LSYSNHNFLLIYQLDFFQPGNCPKDINSLNFIREILYFRTILFVLPENKQIFFTPEK